MSNIMVFKNSSFGSLRVVKINDESWFVAKDVCDCLGLSDVSIALNYLDDDDKGINIIGAQEMSTISDFGFYALIQRSCSPNARAVKLWVTQVVIPSIRKSAVAATHEWVDEGECYIDEEELRIAEEEKMQEFLYSEQITRLDEKRTLSEVERELHEVHRKLAELNDKYAKALRDTANDVRSAYDAQAVLIQYFDTNKSQGDVSFWWYMTVFMRVYCNGGIRCSCFDSVDHALPHELQGQFYDVARRDGLSVFPKRAWADVLVYFKNHKDSLKGLPHIGYAARS